MTACCWLCTTMVALVFWIACTRRGCTFCHLHCCEVFKMRERDHAQIKYEIMNVTRVIMWLVCDNGVKTGKDWVSVAHFIHLFNTTVPMSYTDVHSGAPMSHFLHGRVGMAVRLWFSGCGPTMRLKCHACMPVCKMYNTCSIPLTPLWKTSQVWVSSAARQERPSMIFNFTKIIVVNTWILRYFSNLLLVCLVRRGKLVIVFQNSIYWTALYGLSTLSL